MNCKIYFKLSRAFLNWSQMICLGLAVIGLLGCGNIDQQKRARILELDEIRGRPFGVIELGQMEGLPSTLGRMVFRSFKKGYVSAEVNLGIKLGWLGFGTELRVGTGFNHSTNGGLVLNKVPKDDDAAIFADGQGTLQTRPDEEFTGFCVYDSSYGLAFGGQGEISFAGSSLGGEAGRQKLLAMEVISHVFPIPVDAKLQSLETMCEHLYLERYKSMVQKDLSRAIKAQMTIHRHFDPRVQALEKILQGKWEEVEGQEASWSAGAVESTDQDGKIRVVGQVEVGGKTFRFDHLYQQREPAQIGEVSQTLVLESSSVAPKTMDQRYQQALILAGYLGRNKAEYEAALKAEKSYTVDDSLLKNLK